MKRMRRGRVQSEVQAHARLLLLRAALEEIRTIAYRRQLGDEEFLARSDVPVLEHLRQLADAVDGLWDDRSSVAARYATADGWQREWMDGVLRAAGIEPTQLTQPPARD